MRKFFIAGPILPDEHYHIPPLSRFGADTLLQLVEDKNYFLVYAPRQTGKTTALRALREILNDRGYRAVHVNLQPARTVGDDPYRVIRAVLGRLASRAKTTLGDDYLDGVWRTLLDDYGPEAAVEEALTRWAAADPKPLVVLLDEVDSLRGQSLLSLLDQLRAGYETRPDSFPHSIAVCGLRNVRDYFTPAASPFNIVAKSLRLGNFSEAEVRELLGQHTEETGQRFAPNAIEAIWRATKGQPWLVNALANDACFEDPDGQDRSRDITEEAIFAARERLILAQPVHFEQIALRLEEERVRRVVEPILAANDESHPFHPEDLQYVSDIGLIETTPKIAIANPIYREVIPRALSRTTALPTFPDTARFALENGALDVPLLITEFRQFFRENAEWWAQRFPYTEAAAQVLLQAFLQRVVNAGGHIAREYGLGMGRTDLRIDWRQGPEPQIFVLECKVRRARDGMEELIRRGAIQTARYLDRCAAAEGHLLVFDQAPGQSWEQKFFRRRMRVRRRTVEASPAGTGEEGWEIVASTAPSTAGESVIEVWGM